MDTTSSNMPTAMLAGRQQERQMEKYWQELFMKMTNEELIDCFNSGVGVRAFTRMRGIYLKWLSKEILVRNFESDTLFQFDHKMRLKTIALNRKVKLVNDRLEYSEE